jgi:hypothetical protein
MNMTLLQTVAEAVGLDASQGAILHRSHRGHWEIHGRFRNTTGGRTIMREVSCVPWEGRHPSRLPGDTHNGIQYVPALKGVEDPDRALEIIAAHMKVGVAGSVNTINFDRIALLKAEMKAYNALDLRTAHIVLGGETVTIPPNVIEDWRSAYYRHNTDLMEFWDGTSDTLRFAEWAAEHQPEPPLVGTINANEVTIVDTITGTVEM